MIGQWCVSEYFNMMDEIKQEKYTRMDQTHHLLGGFKATCSDMMIEDIE